MNPSVEEQLQGTVRTLETVVAPAVAESYARTILDNLIANLRMLIVAIPMVPAFTRADNDATLALLMALQDALPPELVARIENAAVAYDVEPDQRNANLRALLAEAVCNQELTGAHDEMIKDYMVNRASRMPMRYVPTVAAIPIKEENGETC